MRSPSPSNSNTRDSEARVTNKREVRRTAAKASLRKSWQLAESSGLPPMTDSAIDREIAKARRAR